MTSSLVGSEMCIRDRYEGSPAIGTILERSNGLAFHSATGSLLLSQSAKAVSYTHLTLPTICSV
eukprot:9739326-Prorocentrum_lima.AAC.1